MFKERSENRLGGPKKSSTFLKRPPTQENPKSALACNSKILCGETKCYNLRLTKTKQKSFNKVTFFLSY